ncbi:MAG: hypothetical protein H0W61_02095 [Bacteroidetes bacterium]|nr:hypothetical protein [Bacteroidota bacterium]
MELTHLEEKRHKAISAGAAMFFVCCLAALLSFVTITSVKPSALINLTASGMMMEFSSSMSSSPDVATKASDKLSTTENKIKSEVVVMPAGVYEIANNFRNRETGSATAILAPANAIEPGTGNYDTRGQNIFVSEGFAFNLGTRKIIGQPEFISDTKEQGKVVVEILVNKNGTVTEATCNGRGTTTSSAALKIKARQMALNTKFTTDNKIEEQRGTITINFSF